MPTPARFAYDSISADELESVKNDVKAKIYEVRCPLHPWRMLTFNPSRMGGAMWECGELVTTHGGIVQCRFAAVYPKVVLIEEEPKRPRKDKV